MSSRILRGVVVHDEPLVIDNAVVFPEVDSFEDQPLTDLPYLVETLQQEHPDAEPALIEDAVNQAIDQLLSETHLREDELAPGVDVLSEQLEDEPSVEFQEAWPEPQTEALITPPPAPAIDAESILAEARRTADELVERAHGEAADVLREADDRAAEIERAAYEKGYEEGLAAAKRQMDEQAARELGQVAEIVDQAAQLHDQMLHEAESEMVALSLEIARKVIQSDVRTNPEIVKKVLAAAVQKINGSPRVTIKVNPAEAERVREHWRSAYGPNFREKEWIIEADESVTPGGCMLLTRYGSLDARIGSQFNEIQRAFALLLGTEG